MERCGVRKFILPDTSLFSRCFFCQTGAKINTAFPGDTKILSKAGQSCGSAVIFAA
jgi:hypothetical protein